MIWVRELEGGRYFIETFSLNSPYNYKIRIYPMFQVLLQLLDLPYD